MNELELARLVDFLAGQDPTLVLFRNVTEREAELANAELERRGSASRVLTGLRDVTIDGVRMGGAGPTGFVFDVDEWPAS